MNGCNNAVPSLPMQRCNVVPRTVPDAKALTILLKAQEIKCKLLHSILEDCTEDCTLLDTKQLAEGTCKPLQFTAEDCTFLTKPTLLLCSSASLYRPRELRGKQTIQISIQALPYTTAQLPSDGTKQDGMRAHHAKCTTS